VKTYHVTSVGKKKQTKIGRAYETDLRVPDISVSRLHAMLHYKNKKFYLEDLDSKFGTLILVQKPMRLNSRTIGKREVRL